jgi:hypothetical protein
VTPEKRARTILAAVSEADAALRRALAKGLQDREIERALSNLGNAQMLLWRLLRELKNGTPRK